MKSVRLILAAVSLALFAPDALALNLMSINQIGTGNIAGAVQYGDGNTGAIDQNGTGNTAYNTMGNTTGSYRNTSAITQTGNGNNAAYTVDGSDNTAAINQAKDGVASIGSGASIMQKGQFHKATITQSGYQNNAAVDEQGQRNEVTIEQYQPLSAKGSESTAILNGDSNIYLNNSLGANYAYSSITGNYNRATVLQANGGAWATRNSATLTVIGNNNASYTNQNGESDTAILNQLGDNASANIVQNGSSNYASVSQTGVLGHVANVNQNGNGGSITIEQHD